MDIIELHERVLDDTGKIVEGVRPEQMEGSTPCTEWNVRTLINHIVGGNLMYVGVAQGQPLQRGAGRDLIGDDPAGAYRQSAAELKRAWREPGRLEQMCRLPWGTMPGSATLSMHLLEVLTHGWDLARATGQRPDFDPEAVQAGLQFAQANMTGERTGEFPFAPVVEAAPDAPEVDKLAAFMGRQV